MIARMWDSGKIILATNKLRDEYEKILDEKGKPVVDKGGNETSQKTGRRVRQGFPDTNYLWQIIIRHLFEPAHTGRRGKWVPHRWGLRIAKCKMNMELIGAELWGDECNFAGLVSLVYPDIPMEAWGF